jgi:hypothetical protein
MNDFLVSSGFWRYLKDKQDRKFSPFCRTSQPCRVGLRHTHPFPAGTGPTYPAPLPAFPYRRYAAGIAIVFGTITIFSGIFPPISPHTLLTYPSGTIIWSCVHSRGSHPLPGLAKTASTVNTKGIDQRRGPVMNGEGPPTRDTHLPERIFPFVAGLMREPPLT